MSIKDQLRNPLVQQYAIEIALPLLGYLLFDWSVIEIIGFYFIDYLASEIARQRRHYKIKTHWNGENSWFIAGIVLSVFFFAGLLFLSWMYIGQASYILISGQLEFSLFFEENWFLLPLVFFANYMKDSWTFYAPRRFVKYNFKNTIKAYVLELNVMAILIVAGLYIWSKDFLPDVPLLLSFVAVKLAFDLIFLKRLKKFAMNA